MIYILLIEPRWESTYLCFILRNSSLGGLGKIVEQVQV